MTTSRHPSLLLLPLVVAALAAPCDAQSPLATPFTATTGSRAAFFDLTVHPPAGVTLTALDLACTGAPGTPATVEVWVIPGTYLGYTDDPSPWTPIATGSFTCAGPGQVSHVCLGAGAHLGATTYGVAVVTFGTMQAQTGGVTCTSTTLPGACANSQFGNAELTLAAGAAQAIPFGPNVTHRRVWNGRIHYGTGSFTSQCATGATVGRGCFTSIYQYFPDAAAAHAALEGQSLTLQLSGGSYRAQWGGGTFVPPGAGAVPVFTPASNDDEAFVAPSQPLPTPQGPQAQLRVSANGIVGWGPLPFSFPGTAWYVPAISSFLDDAAGGIFSWHDYDETETGSGRIVAEERTLGGHPVLLITWNGVENYASTGPFANPGTLQFQLDLVSGNATIVWQHVDSDTSSPWGSGHLVGWTPGGASVDAGAVNLATDLPLVAAPTDAGALLTAGAPFVGTSWVLASQHVGPLAPIAFQVFGTAGVAPGIDLGFAGAPGCRAYHVADLGTFAFPVAGGSGTFTLAVPPVSSLAGAVLHAQTIVLTLDNALHLATSNGLWGRVGY